MNSNRNHTLYGVLFILACLIAAGGLYAIVRSPTSQAAQPDQIMDNTQLNIEEGSDSGTTDEGTLAADPALEPVVAPTPTDNTPRQTHLGMCQTDECSWAKDQSREVVKSDNRGTLVKIMLLDGSSHGEDAPISWIATPHDVYVFCSPALPSVLLDSDGSWQVDVLDFADGVPGVLESSQALYMRTCHAADRQFRNNAETLGYASIPDERESVTISRPEDIFEHIVTAR